MVVLVVETLRWCAVHNAFMRSRSFIPKICRFCFVLLCLVLDLVSFYFEQELHIYWNYTWIYGTSHMDGSSFHFILEWFGLVWFGLLVIPFHCISFVRFLSLLRDVDRVAMFFGSCHSLSYRAVDIDLNRIFDILCSCQFCKWTKLYIRTWFFSSKIWWIIW